MKNYRKVILLVFLVFGFFMRLYALDAIMTENNNPSCVFVFYSTDTIRNDNAIITPIASQIQNLANYSNYDEPILPSLKFALPYYYILADHYKLIDTVDSMIIYRIRDVRPFDFYVIDSLRLDTKLGFSIKFNRNDIIKSKVKSDFFGKTYTVFLKTKILIVVDDMLLDTQEKKKEILSTIDYKQISSIVQYDKKKAIEIYGKKGKHGAIIIELKNKT